MRFIGRFWMDSSPVSVTSKFCGARIPEMSLVVVPELPQSRVHALSVDSDNTILIFDIDSHAAETADGGEAVSALQEVMDLCSSLRNGSEHDTAVGDGFIARDRDLAPDVICFA